MSHLCKERHLFAIFDSMQTGIAVFSKTGNFVYTNKKFDHLFELEDKSHIGQHAGKFFVTAKTGVMAALDGKSNYSICIFSEKSKKYGVSHRFPIYDDTGKIIGSFTETFYAGENKQQADSIKDSIDAINRKLDRFIKSVRTESAGNTGFEHIIGTSAAVRKAKAMIARYAEGGQPVLICGESGTGKELFAHALHMAGSRSTHPFIAVNCAALPSELAESELFGYADGAFSGARRQGMKGKFEQADKGTIFLDEIGELPLSMQAKLLRVLENGEIQKLGGSGAVRVDFRLVAATNRDLERMAREGSFREDLLYRLNVLALRIPPLRERKDDIPDLCAHLLEQILGYSRAREIVLSTEVLAAFVAYPWPGNVRELKNVLTFASYSMDREEHVLRGECLPPTFETYFASAATENGISALSGEHACSLARVSDAAERKAVADALALAAGNKSHAARLLGVSRKTLYKKLRHFGILCRES